MGEYDLIVGSLHSPGSQQCTTLTSQEIGPILIGIFCKYQRLASVIFTLTLTSKYLCIWPGFIPIHHLLYFR